MQKDNVLAFTGKPPQVRTLAPISPGVIASYRAVVMEYLRALNIHHAAPTPITAQYLKISEAGVRLALSVTQEEWDALAVKFGTDDCA